MSNPTVVLLGTLDTKGDEYGYLRDMLAAQDISVVLVDLGVLGDPVIEPDISREQVAEIAGIDLQRLRQDADRGAAVTAMAQAAAVVTTQLHADGRCDGVLAAGGTGNTAIACTAMRTLPFGVPKLMLSTVAAGDTRDYIGGTDLMMMASVADIAGLNSISTRVLGNAANAMAGMVTAGFEPADQARELIAATMFGVTTPCVTTAREALEESGYEVVTFHATGIGGKAMEKLVTSGFFAGVLDITTTELCDDLVGGVFSAGGRRLEAAGDQGVPQVVSLGALDMVNFGAPETVPEAFKDRLFHRHNPSVTLMRTTPEECSELGRRIASKLNKATGPTALFIPLQGVSMIDAEGEPFFDPSARRALIDAIRANLDSFVQLQELDVHINDPQFAIAMAERLNDLITSGD